MSLEEATAVRSRPYVHHPLQRLLQADAGRPEGPNIGANGEHLTIAFALGAFEAAAALCRSVVSLSTFQGEFLVLHTPDERAEAEALIAILSAAKVRYRLIETEHEEEGHLRNLAARSTSMTWLLWTSAGLRFTWNILARTQRDLAELGCHFLALRVTHQGGHATSVLPTVGEQLAASLEATPHGDQESFLSTAFSSQALLFKTETFLHIGGYDEALPGLEDLDLSIRLFQHGYKVGMSALGGLEQSETGAAGGATMPTRVQPAVARAFERKHGFSGAMVSPRPRLRQGFRPSTGPRRPSIALIIDVDNWAFSNIARQLERNLGDRFDFTIIPVAIVDDIPQLFMMCEEHDLVHFFWREVPRTLHTDLRREIEDRGIGYEYFVERFSRRKLISTAVYDHLFLEPEEVKLRAPLFREWCSAGYYVCSQKLYDIYACLPGYPAPDAVLPDGVDLSVFRPHGLDRFNRISNRPISVGWVGNSGWAEHLGDPKGVNTILRPALAQLAGEGVPTEAQFADRQHRMIPHHDMPGYYAEVDVLVCASEIEGTPNPVLEAMACGVPVITTDVGVVRQALGPLQQDFILPVRSVDAMKGALRRLHQDRALFAALSAENLSSIKTWDWPLMAERFARFFDNALALRKEATGGCPGGAQLRPH